MVPGQFDETRRAEELAAIGSVKEAADDTPDEVANRVDAHAEECAMRAMPRFHRGAAEARFGDRDAEEKAINTFARAR